MPDAVTQTMQTAVHQYFSGERNEALVATGIYIITTGGALALYLYSGSGLAKAFLITIAICALLMIASGVSLMLRDGKTATTLLDISDVTSYIEALSNERNRLNVIIVNYRY